MASTKLFYALLSGLHATLPLAELRGILEALGQRYRVVETLDLVAVYESSAPSSRGVASRAGLIHETGRVLAVTEARLADILDEAEFIDWCAYFSQGDRVKFELVRLRGYAKDDVPDNAARRLAERAAPLLRGCGVEATPREPTRHIRLIVSLGTAIIALREDEQPKKLLEQHRPQKRPFFHPGSLDPRLARLFINLARAAPPGPYLDPFCGTGGFAIEAQTLGIQTLCGELAKKLAEGARRNTQAYPGAMLTENLQWDATRLPIRDNTVQSIGTDPPYGRSTSTRGKPLQQLLPEFLQEAARVLKPGAHLAFAAPHWIQDKLQDYTEQAGLKTLEQHYMKVHGSLTRIVVVAINKNKYFLNYY
ncbi:hypothetical protein [Pyrofollis japonicus]|uniref:hypothetical protein n=1 Tax=Pyrofollis japonicus TaxID=3060460 RepID=UPI00295AD7EA|nr:hypothetical protein [Pyrofollis japonicus]